MHLLSNWTLDGRVLRGLPVGLLVLLASCGEPVPENVQAPDLPQPSGPPIAQQADAVPSTAPSRTGPVWEITAGSGGTALRLVDRTGRLLLTMGCRGSPPTLAATAPGFSAIGSEDRFSLGLGLDPVTLVADLSGKQPGVTAEAPAPSDFGERLQDAKKISALYGTQQIGPVTAPSDALKESLARACLSPQ